MRLLFLLLSLLPVQNECLQVDILLVVDVSTSVAGEERFVKEAINMFVSQFELSEETVKVGLVTFGDNAHLVCPLTTDKALLNVNLSGWGSTNMAEGFFVAFNELMKSGRPGYRKVIVLLSDGQPDEKEATKTIASQISQANVLVYGIVIEAGGRDEAFMDEISDHYLKSDFTRLPEEIKKLDVCL